MKRFHITLAVLACSGLAACGGPTPRADVSMSRNFSGGGPLQTACLRADRRAANVPLCGCVQSAANATLSRGDQARAASFFSDPHQAQVVRQSDRRSDEAFWQRYKGFVEVAERACA
ncbi:MAG: hypothetical protein AAF919_10485 [Pseudomonadota bacterium]